MDSDEKMYKYDSAESVELEYRWDLEACLQGKSIEEYIERYKELSEEYIRLKEEKYKSKELYLKAIEVGEEMSKNLEIPYQYLANKLSTNLVSHEVNRQMRVLQDIYSNFSSRYGSEKHLIKLHKKQLKEWAELPELRPYKISILAAIDDLKYSLNSKVEDYIQRSSKGSISLTRVFSILQDSEIDYGYVKVRGEKIKITDANTKRLMEEGEERIRKTVYFNREKAKTKHRESSAQLLIQHLRRGIVESKIRGYKSYLHSLIREDNIHPSLLTTLFKNVKSLMPLFERKKRFFRACIEKKYNKRYRVWDGELKLVDVKSSYTIEESQDIVLEALSFMPKDYYDVLRRAIKEERWIDYMNYPNKRSGAYSIGGSYHIPKKYILMNFDGSFRSISTIAHEIGHSMHSYFSDKKQDYHNSQYTIFLAEIASIFNEIALTKYMLKKYEGNKEVSFYLLEEFIDLISGTVARQTIWSNYEYNLYKAIEEEKPIASFRDLEELFYANEKSYDKSLTKRKWEANPAYINYSCMVPHYYYNFYVYKYALGFMIACGFYSDYEERGEPALRNYIDNFLSAGSSDWPANILKQAGIDIYSKQLASLTTKILKDALDRYISLGRELFGIDESDLVRRRKRNPKDSE